MRSPLPIFESRGSIEPAEWVRASGIEFLLPQADQVVTPYLRKKKEWDETLHFALLEAVKSRSVFVDVGAMVGYFSVVVAKEFPESKVYAVEPSESSLEFASRNAEPYANVTLLAGGVSNDPRGSWSLVKDETNRGNTKIEVTGGSEGSIVTCTLQSLIDFTDADVVKIDVQGMERAVLTSLDLSKRKNRDLTIFCEISPTEWASQDEIVETVAEFQAAGFEAYFLLDTLVYSEFTKERLSDRVALSSAWADHFELMLVRGTNAKTVRAKVWDEG